MTAFCNSKHKLIRPLCRTAESKPSFCDSGKKYILLDCSGYNVCYLKYDETEYKRLEGHNRAVDYIILTCKKPVQKPKIAILVELKGTNVSSAMEQIIDTLEREKSSILSEYVVLARIVCTRTVAATLNQNLQTKLNRALKKHNKTVGYYYNGEPLGRKSSDSHKEKLSGFYENLLK